jgi:hypothetical protein
MASGAGLLHAVHAVCFTLQVRREICVSKERALNPPDRYAVCTPALAPAPSMQKGVAAGSCRCWNHRSCPAASLQPGGYPGGCVPLSGSLRKGHVLMQARTDTGVASTHKRTFNTGILARGVVCTGFTSTHIRLDTGPATTPTGQALKQQTNQQASYSTHACRTIRKPVGAWCSVHQGVSCDSPCTHIRLDAGPATQPTRQVLDQQRDKHSHSQHTCMPQRLQRLLAVGVMVTRGLAMVTPGKHIRRGQPHRQQDMNWSSKHT